MAISVVHVVLTMLMVVLCGMQSVMPMYDVKCVCVCVGRASYYSGGTHTADCGGMCYCCVCVGWYIDNVYDIDISCTVDIGDIGCACGCVCCADMVVCDCACLHMFVYVCIYLQMVV